MPRLRSPAEIGFRLRQERDNLRYWLAPPEPSLPPAAPRLPLPGPAGVAAALSGSAYAGEVERLAQEVCAHRFPMLGLTIDTGSEIHWRKDHVSGIETPPRYFRTIPYLDAARAGDHKIVWELNRHQHLVLLAQAALLGDAPCYRQEIERQLTSWWEQNSMQRGINWASALEVAFRALSWLWLDHLAGEHLQPATRARLHLELYRHGCHLASNLSVYFSPNTHLLGEAVALASLACAYPEWPRAAAWKELGHRWVMHELNRQVHSDGGHFEHSTYYHVYALDMFLWFYLIAGRPEPLRARLLDMAALLDAVVGDQGSLPFLGDDDGGAFFHPYGDRSRFALRTLATCAALFDRPEWLRDAADLHAQSDWWLGPRKLTPAAATRPSTLFRDTGLAILAAPILNAPGVQVIVDIGTFGYGRGGHSHSDSLSIVVRAYGRDVLLDPGTFTYVGDAAARNWFRGSAAHNTVRIGGLDQADPAGPFAWNGRPQTELLGWQTSPDCDSLDARCRYRGFAHRRRIVFHKPRALLVLDEVEGAVLPSSWEQFWHPAACEPLSQTAAFALGNARLLLAGAARVAVESGWRSPAYGVREPAPVIVAVPEGRRLGAAIVLGTEEDAALEFTPQGLRLQLGAATHQLAI